MDEIIEEISLAFRCLQDCITRLPTIETPGDDFYIFDDTADRFSVWLRNVVVIREECKTFENCLSNNPELKDTLIGLLVDVKDDLSEAQDTAQWKLDNRSRANAKLVAASDAPDDVPVLSLSTILQDVYNTTCCLMRLSKPLLDSHRSHRMTARPCDRDDSHHVSHLQRVIPRAKSEILKRLSRSICARSLEILRMNTQQDGFGRALGEGAFLRMVLLELASVSDEAMQHESSTGRSLAADPGLEVEPNSFEDVEDKEFSDEKILIPDPGQVDSLFNTPEYAKINIVQRPEETINEAKSHGRQEAKQAPLIDHGSSDDRPIVHTVPVCTRCRVRKTRCDPGLPKCGPCERTGSTCEYYDSSKGRVLNRNYIVYLQHKVRELEDELERATNFDLSKLNKIEDNVSDGAASPPSIVAATDQGPTSKNCVMCRRDVMYSDKSELRQHYFHDLQPYICLRDGCSSRHLRYSTIDEWTEHIRGCHELTWRCMFGCNGSFFARTAFEEHMIAEHRGQITSVELPTLAELCMKHTLATNLSNATQCPCCGEAIDGPDRFYHHLAKHMEDVALLSLAPGLPCEFSETTKTDVQPTVKMPSTLQPKTSSVQYLSPVQHHEIEQPSGVHADHDHVPSDNPETSDVETVDFITLFSIQPGYKTAAVNIDDLNSAWSIEFDSAISAFRAAYKLNHRPLPNSLATRLTIDLCGTILKVRVDPGGSLVKCPVDVPNSS